MGTPPKVLLKRLMPARSGVDWSANMPPQSYNAVSAEANIDSTEARCPHRRRALRLLSLLVARKRADILEQGSDFEG